MDKSQDFIDMMTALNKDLTYYVIEPTNKAIGEEGKYLEGERSIGYAIINTVTGITEHTSTILPGIIFQAQHFDSTLKSLLTKKDTTSPMQEAAGEDVVFM